MSWYVCCIMCWRYYKWRCHTVDYRTDLFTLQYCKYMRKHTKLIFTLFTLPVLYDWQAPPAAQAIPQKPKLDPQAGPITEKEVNPYLAHEQYMKGLLPDPQRCTYTHFTGIYSCCILTTSCHGIYSTASSRFCRYSLVLSLFSNIIYH
jgi:hypothetical protein